MFSQTDKQVNNVKRKSKVLFSYCLTYLTLCRVGYFLCINITSAEVFCNSTLNSIYKISLNSQVARRLELMLIQRKSSAKYSTTTVNKLGIDLLSDERIITAPEARPLIAIMISLKTIFDFFYQQVIVWNAVLI